MPTIDPPIEIKVWGADRTLIFADFESVAGWVEGEIARWAVFKAPTTSRLPKIHALQNQALNSILAAARSGDKQRLQAALNGVTIGTTVTSDSPYFPAIARLGGVDGDLSALLLLSARSDAQTQASHMGFTAPFDLILRLAVSESLSHSESHVDSLVESLKEARRLKEACEEELAQLKLETEAAKRSAVDASSAFTTELMSREKEWKEKKDQVDDDWSKLKLVYDTELGLRAPTTYWTDRAKSHKDQAVLFGLAFGIFAASMIGLFFLFGVGHIAESESAPLVSVLVPILLPAFAGVWILRILGRLLSESLHLMRDAKERETLVKTFLALMKDDTTGKAVIKDEDRILILHSLFRASSVVATDDAPPVHWFDILANKVGGKK